MSTSATPDPLHNEALDELKKELQEKGVDGLVTPDEVVFQAISDPQPTDSIGSEDWNKGKKA
ncbi:hypothetical protein [Microbacterium sp. GXF7504]